MTLTADDASIPLETIRVGLWNGTAGQGTRSTAGTFAKLEMDPIRPYVYVHGGGTDITVYNVYTGAVVKTLSHVAPVLGSLAASSDGARLYAEDVTNHRVVPIDLASWTTGAPWRIISYSPANLAYTRTSGAPVLFAGYGCAYHADTGASLSASPMASSCGTLAATSVAGNRICGTDTGASPHNIFCRSIDYTAAQGRLVPGDQVTGFTQGYRGDLALDLVGARVYVGQGYSGTWDAATMEKLQTFTGVRNFEVTRDGRVIAASNASYPNPDLMVMDVDGFTLHSYRVAGSSEEVLDGLMKVTGDGFCVAAITGLNSGGRLVFQFIDP